LDWTKLRKEGKGEKKKKGGEGIGPRHLERRLSTDFFFVEPALVLVVCIPLPRYRDKGGGKKRKKKKRKKEKKGKLERLIVMRRFRAIRIQHREKKKKEKRGGGKLEERRKKSCCF